MPKELPIDVVRCDDEACNQREKCHRFVDRFRIGATLSISSFAGFGQSEDELCKHQIPLPGCNAQESVVES